MEWVTIGIIFFLAELYVITHTYVLKYGLTKASNNSHYRVVYDIIEGSEKKLPLTVGRLLVLIIANIIPVINTIYLLIFTAWWIKRASAPEDRYTACIIWRFKYDKFTASVIAKLKNLLNKEL